MKYISTAIGLAFTLLLFVQSPVSGEDVDSVAAAPTFLKLSEANLRGSGAFGFPQTLAKVLCDNADLRLSAWNNSLYFYVQAVLWKDNDWSLGKTEDGRTIGDYSELLLDVDANGDITANVDRNYLLNPWPTMLGLYYQISLGRGSTTHIMSDTTGRGAIRYIQTPEGKIIRVDSFLIPLAELSKQVSDKIRLCYWGDSPKPALTVNSAGYDAGGKRYYGYRIPIASYHDYVFTAGGELALDSVPDGRSDRSLAAPRDREPMPKVGVGAPEIAAKDWLNVEKTPTLGSLHGNVVLVEFWATWCGPCIESIPHLNELQRKYTGRGFKILSFTEQNRQGVENFLKHTPMDYSIGLESDATFDRYGVTGIPQAFLVDGSGKIVWEGNSGDQALEGAVQAALTSK